MKRSTLKSVVGLRGTASWDVLGCLYLEDRTKRKDTEMEETESEAGDGGRWKQRRQS